MEQNYNYEGNTVHGIKRSGIYEQKTYTADGRTPGFVGTPAYGTTTQKQKRQIHTSDIVGYIMMLVLNIVVIVCMFFPLVTIGRRNYGFVNTMKGVYREFKYIIPLIGKSINGPDVMYYVLAMTYELLIGIAAILVLLVAVINIISSIIGLGAVRSKRSYALSSMAHTVKFQFVFAISLAYYCATVPGVFYGYGYLIPTLLGIVMVLGCGIYRLSVKDASLRRTEQYGRKLTVNLLYYLFGSFLCLLILFGVVKRTYINGVVVTVPFTRMVSDVINDLNHWIQDVHGTVKMEFFICVSISFMVVLLQITANMNLYTRAVKGFVKQKTINGAAIYAGIWNIVAPITVMITENNISKISRKNFGELSGYRVNMTNSSSLAIVFGILLIVIAILNLVWKKCATKQEDLTNVYNPTSRYGEPVYTNPQVYSAQPVYMSKQSTPEELNAVIAQKNVYVANHPVNAEENPVEPRQ